MRANTTCTTTEVRKRRTTVMCTIEEAVLSGTTTPAFEMVLGGILEEYGSLLAGATVELTVKADGSLAAIDIEGLPRDNARDVDVQTMLRALSQQLFAGFDFRAPPPGATTWSQPNPKTASPLNPQGTVARASLAHRVTTDRDDVLTIESTGVASLGIRGSMESNQTAGELFVLKGQTGGQTEWDRADGTLLTRTWWTHLESTASAPRMLRPMLAADKDGNTRQVFSTAGLLVRLPSDTAFPELGRSRLDTYDSLCAQVVDARVLGEDPGALVVTADSVVTGE